LQFTHNADRLSDGDGASRVDIPSCYFLR
jgi:hypothetical protein